MSKFSNCVRCCALAGLLLSPISAMAQDNYGLASQQKDQFDMTASVGFKIPLGAIDSDNLSSQPRFGLGINLDHRFTHAGSGEVSLKRLDLLNIGFYDEKTPSLTFSGQEIYIPTRLILQADETGEDLDKNADKKGNSSLFLIGGAVILGAATLVVVNEIDDEIDDCRNALDRPGECLN